MKGAVSTIALILIAAVVIIAIGYNFYKPTETPTTPRTTLTERECQNKLISYCTTWSANGYGRDAVSARGRPGLWDSFARGCSSLGITPTADVCDRTIKASAVTGRATAVARLGFLEPCSSVRGMCDIGLVCKLGRDNIYRCLRQS